MQYFGGKSRIGKQLASEISLHIDNRAYWEPFCGALSVIMHINASKRYASDIHVELISLWQAMQNGWIPPTTVTEEEYNAAKSGYGDSHYRAFVGFGCSFGDKWFRGYARGNRNYPLAAHKSCLRKMTKCQDVVFFRDNFDRNPPEQAMIIYCDPPYANTTNYSIKSQEYSTAKIWNAARFWGAAREWTQSGHIVFVSERNAPNDFVSIWQANIQDKAQNNATGAQKKIVTEHLFVHKSCNIQPAQLPLF